MFNRIKSLVIKEFISILGDKTTRIVLIVPPLLQLIIFSFAATLEVKEVPIAVLNRDWGKASQELIYRFEGSAYFPEVYRLNSPEQVREYINTQKVPLVVEINDDFSKNYYSGQTAEIQLILDGRKTNVSQILAGYVNAIVDGYNLDTYMPRCIIVSRNWFNENLDYRLYTVPCIAGVITTLLGLIITALSVAREREFGTFDQLLVSPLEPMEMLVGKTIPAFVFGMLEATLIITAGILIFRVPFEGSIFALYFAMSIYLLSVIGVGLFISTISKTQQQAILGAFVFLVPAILLSGYATPVENMPEWLQAVTVVNPLKHFLVIIKGILLKNMPFIFVLQYIIPIAIIAVINLAIAVQMFKRRLE